MLTITFGGETTGDYSRARDKEWLITNGLGGYSSSTIIGANTRGYHGLLVAGTGADIRRTLLLSKLEEEVIVDGVAYPLSTNRYPGAIYPEGYRHLKEFRLDPNPFFHYEVGGVHVIKAVRMPSGSNSVIISYTSDSPEGVGISIRPLTTNRGFHSRLREGSTRFTQRPGDRKVVVESGGDLSLTLEASHGSYVAGEAWYRNMLYEEETERGLDDREDLYSPGVFLSKLGRGLDYRIGAYTGHFERKPEQASQLTGPDELESWLHRSSDQFIVTLPNDDRAIVAGYHWFGEWGRDSAISLPGLLLATGRYTDARKVIRRLLRNTVNGLTPNLICDGGERLYNSVDASLWLVYAAYKYHLYTGDTEFLRRIYPQLMEIVGCCSRGNQCIGAADDGLLETVDEGSSYTWMDARADGAPVTPRVGKCVEVNALYYNALMSLGYLSSEIGEESNLGVEAERVKNSFNEAFWSPGDGYLFDYVTDGVGDPSIRPNQVLSISLPYPVLERAHWESVYKVIERDLLTPYGLRTLSPRDPRYRGRCVGNPGERDLSYHNGTVWAWLVGPFITAHIRLGLPGDAQVIGEILNHFKLHLRDAGIGSVSEIFDGDPPHRPRGCIAQAWSVGELLRTIHEDLLYRS